ncbi:Multi antimicrobial extrusion protein [Parasponia andersonii]|uniref:Multi antimicrobial extrusion protein n=1 Tax=Parasponia andersonii TaxID=3476 RepID=A0A2P5DLE2_PARAD|nr:Multi antimicrobial extrusion protein [Parasponia andersonii]
MLNVHTMYSSFQWWSSQLLTLLSGFLPNPELETSMFSLCLATISAIYSISEGLGAAGSTRVSNELGASNPRAARLACRAVMILTVFEAVTSSSVIFASRRALGHIFSNEKEVVDYAAEMAPLVSISVIFRSFSAVLSGIARGCGLQKLGAFVNLGSYYCFGIPIAAILAFRFHLRGKGLWIGFVAGSFLQAFLFSLITLCINWDKKARLVRERIFSERTQRDIGLTEQSNLN